jgi:molybdopterin-guanine dinucleotide biosynthesis protein A
MPVSSQPVTAFILAGGKSSRMGQDKAFLSLAGKSLISHALDLARSVAQHVAIVGDPAKFASFAPVLPDAFTGCGPLAGIHAALQSSSTDLNLMLAVDIPFVEPAFLRFLISAAETSGALVTVPFAARHLHTLCAVYRKGFFQIADRALASGQNRIDALFSSIKVRVIDEPQLQAAGFHASMFRNLNTPGEFEAAAREYELRRLRL